MRILKYLEQITKGKITKFKKISYLLNDEYTQYKFNKYIQYELIDKELTYNFLSYLRKDSDKLVIFFNGANMIVGNLSAFNSDDGLRLAFKLGFGF